MKTIGLCVMLGLLAAMCSPAMSSPTVQTYMLRIGSEMYIGELRRPGETPGELGDCQDFPPFGPGVSLLLPPALTYPVLCNATDIFYQETATNQKPPLAPKPAGVKGHDGEMHFLHMRIYYEFVLQFSCGNYEEYNATWGSMGGNGKVDTGWEIRPNNFLDNFPPLETAFKYMFPGLTGAAGVAHTYNNLTNGGLKAIDPFSAAATIVIGGAPAADLEYGFTTAGGKERTNRYIWHALTITVACTMEEEATVFIDVTATRFPSHRINVYKPQKSNGTPPFKANPDKILDMFQGTFKELWYLAREPANPMQNPPANTGNTKSGGISITLDCTESREWNSLPTPHTNCHGTDYQF